MREESLRILEQAQSSLAAEKAGVLATVEALRGDLASLREANQGLTRRTAQQETELEGARQQASRRRCFRRARPAKSASGR